MSCVRPWSCPTRSTAGSAAAAAERGLRGFSELIEEAVDSYLAREHERRDLVRAIESAQGSWSEADLRDWERAQDDARARGPSDRS
jgi:hypothetical protein